MDALTAVGGQDPGSPDFVDSSLREKLIEHLFVGDLLRSLWQHGIRGVEVLRAEVDSGGYDLVLECNGITRHVQLKSSHRDARTAAVNVHVRLANRRSGCVIWIFFDPRTVALGPFLWLGAPPGEPLPLLTGKIARHTKANSIGFKAERPNLRVVRKRDFEQLATINDVVHRLFGVLQIGL